MTDLVAFQEQIGFHFYNQSLLKESLLHSSYLNENPNLGLACNERLEFLGDALLDFLMAESLYQSLPELSEGELTNLRSGLVCTETLAQVAQGMGLGKHLLLGRGEELSGGRSRPTTLAGAFEALLGAIHLDQGVEAARRFLLRWLGPELERAIKEGGRKDSKTALQELVQGRFHLTPSYRTVAATGPEHEREFTVEVLAGEKALARGRGRSKQAAEEEAAREALQSWEKLETELLGEISSQRGLEACS